MRRLFINQKANDLETVGVVVAKVDMGTMLMDEEYLNANDLKAAIQRRLDEIAGSVMEQPEGLDMVSASSAWKELNDLKKDIVSGFI